VQATGAKQPTYKVGIVNGKPVVRFNAAHGLATPSIDLGAFSSYTLMVVGASIGNAADQIYTEFSSNYNSFTDGFVVLRPAAGGIQVGHKGNVGYDSATTQRTWADSVFEVYLAQHDKSVTPNRAIGTIHATEVSVYPGGLLEGNWDEAGNVNNANNFGNQPLYIGSRNNGAALQLKGDIAEIALYAPALTDANWRRLVQYAQTKYALKRPSGTMIHEGDSMTYQYSNATSPYPGQLHTLLAGDGRAYNWGNYGINGQTLANMAADAATQTLPWKGSNGGQDIAVIWGGLNDMNTINGNVDGATTYARLVTLCGLYRNAGFKLIVLNTIDDQGPGAGNGAGNTFDTRRAAYNALIAAGWSGIADGLVDLAVLSQFQNALDTTYYAADHTHLNNTGLGLVAAAVRTAVLALP
jgi:hypothetical protein